MKKILTVLMATGAAAATLALSAGPAGAAHCAEKGGPGNSDFGAHAAASGPGAHNEGDHKGWSSCIPGNPNAGFVR